MHFIIGGAFNGKRAWVKNTFKVKAQDHWLSAYDNIPLPHNLMDVNQAVIILEGVELWVKELTAEYDADKCREMWNKCLDNWLAWEKEAVKRKLIVIGTDITKGIVPMDAENRVWRDVTGWAYQDITARSENVDVIWYGLKQTIK